MTKLARFSVVLCLALVSGSCSYATAFVFVNGTSVAARVSYTYRDPVVDWDAPALGDCARGPWKVLEPKEYSSTPDRKRLTVVVPPGQALRFFTLINYPGNDLRGLERFPLSEITVGDDESAVTVQDAHAVLAFQRWSNRLYVFPVTVSASTGRG